MRPIKLWELVKAAVAAWREDEAPSMGAALAYYTIFSIAPLLLLLIAVAGAFFGADAARGQIVAELGGLMGKEGATAIEGLLKSASQPDKNVIAMLISAVTLLIGATTVFAELQSDLDRIWKAPAAVKPSGIWGLLRARFLSFGMILGVGFLLVVSLALSAGLSALGSWWGPLFAGWAILLQVINFIVSFAVTTATFAIVYKVMPSVKIRWRDVWVGAGVTALLFTIGKYLIGAYIGKTGVASGFGAAGSLIVVLVWVYFSAQIFLLGAEFTWVYARTSGSHAGAGAAVKNGATAALSGAEQASADLPTGSALAAEAYRGGNATNVDGEHTGGKRAAVVAAVPKAPPLKRGLIRVLSALAAGWFLGYTFKFPIQSQTRRWLARF